MKKFKKKLCCHTVGCTCQLLRLLTCPITLSLSLLSDLMACYHHQEYHKYLEYGALPLQL